MNIAELQKKAKSGSIVAQTVLGICYLDGTEVELNYTEAFRLLSLAADRGAPRAMMNLARMHADGLGIPKNTSEALRLYEAAANAGEFAAQIELARAYSRGIDVKQDIGAARLWYSTAVAQEAQVGDRDALREAKSYLSTRSQPPDAE